jgi:hypothetical protein
VPGAATPTTLAPGEPVPADATTSTVAGAPATSGPRDPDEPAGRALGGVDLSSQTHDAGGAPWITIVGVALIVGLASAAGLVAFRRRRAAEAG